MSRAQLWSANRVASLAIGVNELCERPFRTPFNRLCAPYIVVTFPYRSGGGGQRAKSAQDTIKILMQADFSSNLAPFLTNMGLSTPLGGHPNIGGGGLGPSQRDIKLRPWRHI